MKLTGILKNKVDKAETMAEKKDLIAEAGMELNDNELEMVTGGVSLSDDIDRMKSPHQQVYKRCKINHYAGKFLKNIQALWLDDCYLSMLFIN